MSADASSGSETPEAPTLREGQARGWDAPGDGSGDGPAAPETHFTEESAEGTAEHRGSTPQAFEEHEGEEAFKARLPFALRKSMRFQTAATVGLFALACFYTLYFAASLFLPIVIAMVLNLLFRPVVRAMKRYGLPDPLGAALVIFVVLGAFGYGLYELSGPASRWAERAPTYLRQAEAELRGLFESVQNMSRSAAEVGERISGGGEGADGEGNADGPQAVQIAQPSAADVLLSQTTGFLVSAAVVFFLLYFLLASGDLFLRKIVRSVPLLRQKRIAVQIARSAEKDLSTYLATYAVINAVLGAVVGAILYVLGMPSPVLWGVMAALLNFMPYLGAAIGVSVVALVAFVSIEPTGRALAAPLLYFLVNSLEGNLVTPMVLGRRLQLNPVAIFVSLTFWYWLWGVPGALLATPLLVSLKVVCDNVITLRAVGEFIGR